MSARRRPLLFSGLVVAATAIVGGSSSSSPASVRPRAAPRIVAVGDIACDPASAWFNAGNGTATACRHKAVASLVVGGAYSAFLSLGDSQYENGSYAAFLASYDVAFGPVRSITRPVPGNHEYSTTAAGGYFKYFGAAAGDPAKGYYSYDIGAWHIIALNSNCGAVACGRGFAQQTWLRSDLAAHAAKCALVYWHHPRYSSGEHGNSTSVAALYQTAYDGGVDVALAGHDHDYERFAPQNGAAQLDVVRGIREFVVGTGGKSHYRTTTIKANSELRNSDAYGVLEFTLHATSYDWRFVAESGKTLDAGTQTCH